MTFFKNLRGRLPSLSQFLATESPSKMLKNAFYFTVKVLFVLKMFKFFVLTFLVTNENGLMRKLRLISEFMTPSIGKQLIAIRSLSNISRSKNDQKVS